MLKESLKILSLLAVMSLMTVITNSCEDNKTAQTTNFSDNKQKRDSLENLNRQLLLQEKAAIKDYIEKNSLDVIETGTGLCYHIVNQGDGELIKAGDIVALDYELRLLDGELLYSSAENGVKAFVVGHGGVESGLEEAILHLHKGDEAIIIIPSYLAHGLAGDGDKIPLRATIVYNVKVIENQSNN